MEFRYRAIDGDRPPTVADTAPTQSSNQSLSLLSARPIAGSSEDHVREAIKREIEKEQIRQDIIFVETARRRELIAEVIQEMAIEREMAIRRVAETAMSSEDKLIQRKLLPNQIQNNNTNNNNNFFRQNQNLMCTGPCSLLTSSTIQLSPLEKIAEATGVKATSISSTMQLSPLEQMAEATGAKATSIMESKKDKLIVLNRPDAVGVKRKAEDTQTDLERAKRKADVVGLARDPNLLGPEDEEKETALKNKTMSVETGETVSVKLLPCLEKLDTGKQVEKKQKHKFKFWCDICGVGAFSKTVMRNHELGKKHIAAIKQQNEPIETASASFIITAPSQSEAVTVRESDNAQDKKEVDETAAKETGLKKKRVKFWCEICNIQTYSEQVMETHRLGKKHKALLEKQKNKPEAVLNTNLITVPVISLNADAREEGKVHCLDKS